MSTPLRIVPLGGLGEIGRNMMALECGDDIIVIDAGLMFPEQEMLGIDLVIPDIAWLLERADRVRAICLTHGHEDHIGALAYTLPRLDVPVYGTALTLAILRNKFKERKLSSTARLNKIAPGETVQFGCFSVEWIHTTHSIPDSCALAIYTPHGTVIHTGDFKLDQTPINGTPPDLARLARLGDDGVLLLLSDSTNAESEGMTPSERTVGHGLMPIVEGAEGRVIVATFASNLGRVQQVIDIATELGRKCFLAGRSMLNNVSAASELGYLRSAEAGFLTPRQLDSVADEDLIILCTGAQGEPFSALTRIAGGDHPMVDVRVGDTVIISANPIPGNEEAVHRTINRLYKRGARVFSGARHHVHASGHASREELKLILTLIRPKYFVPVHGEYRHLAIHAELASSVGISRENIIAMDSGTILEIDEDGAKTAGDRAQTGYVYVDGLNVDESGDVVLRDRRDMAHDGIIVVIVSVDRETGEIITGPELVTRGFVEDMSTEKLFDDAREHVLRTLTQLKSQAPSDTWQSTIHDELARFVAKRARRQPLILPLVTAI